MAIKEGLEDILRIFQECFGIKRTPYAQIWYGDYMEVNLNYTEHQIEDIAKEINETINLELDYDYGGYQACVYHMIPGLGTIMFKQHVDIEEEDSDEYFD